MADTSPCTSIMSNLTYTIGCNYPLNYRPKYSTVTNICDPILENGAYCGIYDFELEHTKDKKVTLCQNSFYCINMFYKEIPFV